MDAGAASLLHKPVRDGYCGAFHYVTAGQRQSSCIATSRGPDAFGRLEPDGEAANASGHSSFD